THLAPVFPYTTLFRSLQPLQIEDDEGRSEDEHRHYVCNGLMPEHHRRPGDRPHRGRRCSLDEPAHLWVAPVSQEEAADEHVEHRPEEHTSELQSRSDL